MRVYNRKPTKNVWKNLLWFDGYSSWSQTELIVDIFYAFEKNQFHRKRRKILVGTPHFISTSGKRPSNFIPPSNIKPRSHERYFPALRSKYISMANFYSSRSCRLLNSACFHSYEKAHTNYSTREAPSIHIFARDTQSAQRSRRFIDYDDIENAGSTRTPIVSKQCDATGSPSTQSYDMARAKRSW